MKIKNTPSCVSLRVYLSVLLLFTADMFHKAQDVFYS